MIKVYTVKDDKINCRTSDRTLAPERSYAKDEKKDLWERFSESEKEDIRDICRVFGGKLC